MYRVSHNLLLISEEINSRIGDARTPAKEKDSALIMPDRVSQEDLTTLADILQDAPIPDLLLRVGFMQVALNQAADHYLNRSSGNPNRQQVLKTLLEEHALIEDVAGALLNKNMPGWDDISLDNLRLKVMEDLRSKDEDVSHLMIAGRKNSFAEL